jgi:hypothetical protein
LGWNLAAICPLLCLSLFSDSLSVSELNMLRVTALQVREAMWSNCKSKLRSTFSVQSKLNKISERYRFRFYP